MGAGVPDNSRREAGFTLMELLIVVAILGMITLILTIAVSDTIKRQRVGEAAQEMRNTLQAVYTQVVTSQKPAFVRINMTTRKLEVMGDAAGATILTYYSIPSDISLSTTDITQVQTNWPLYNSMPTLECDTMGRALYYDSGSAKWLLPSSIFTFVVTHDEMVQGTMGHRVLYTISLNPLWNTVAVRSTW